MLKVSIEKSVFLLLKSSATIQNLELSTQYNNIYSDFMFVYPVYLQDRKVTMKDLHISVSGTILRVYDPLYIWIENIDVDYYRNLGGFDMIMDCNYPEANLHANMYALNTSFYYGSERAVNPTTGAQLESGLPGDMVVVDHVADTYIYFHEKHGLVVFKTSESCTPDNDVDRDVNITNANVTIPEPLSVGNLISMNLLIDHYKRSHIYLENIDCSDAYMSVFGAVLLFGNQLSNVTTKNIINVNTRSLLGINWFDNFYGVFINDMYIENADTVEVFIVSATRAQIIGVNNVTINNNDISSTDPTGIIHLSPLSDGVATVSNFTVMNSDIGAKQALDYRQAGSGNITIENVYVKNVTLGADTKIIRTPSISSFHLKNSTFIDVKPQNLGDSTPKLVELPSIVMANQSEFSFEDTYIENSKVGFIELSGLKLTESLTSSFMLTNFTYADSYIEFSHDLLSFTGVETSNDFQISLSDINYRNITFVRAGNLIRLEHQTSTILTLDKAMFENIVGGQILITSSNLQNTDLKTRVNMTSITASNMSGNSRSLIQVEEGGELYIYNSQFMIIDNTERGAVLNAGYQNSLIEVHNSTFENNLSIYGGVSNIQDGSVIKFYDSNFTNNFAIQGGAIQVSSDGRFELYR